MPDSGSPKPFILMCAPNGARRSKDDHEALPISPEELADCAADIVSAGASILHLHVRDAVGKHSLAVEDYRPAIKAIKNRVGDWLVIQVTTEAVGQYSRDEQMAVVRKLKPEAVSIALREICPADSDIDSTASFFAWMRAEKIFPQIILYDQADVIRFLSLHADGVFATKNPFVLCVLGRHGTDGEEPAVALRAFAASLTEHSIEWAVCGFGAAEHALAAEAARLGGHVRVGFENNLWRADGSIAANNTELVSGAKEAAGQNGRILATAQDVRRKFAF